MFGLAKLGWGLLFGKFPVRISAELLAIANEDFRGISQFFHENAETAFTKSLPDHFPISFHATSLLTSATETASLNDVRINRSIIQSQIEP
jgi:hypothetical protein